MLTIEASDGKDTATATVEITIKNVNDEPPQFEDRERNVTFAEEEIPSSCIFRVKNDFKNPNA